MGRRAETDGIEDVRDLRAPTARDLRAPTARGADGRAPARRDRAPVAGRGQRASGARENRG